MEAPLYPDNDKNMYKLKKTTIRFQNQSCLDLQLFLKISNRGYLFCKSDHVRNFTIEIFDSLCAFITVAILIILINFQNNSFSLN